MAITWSTYNLLRKKINVRTDIGLFIETIFIVPVALILFYFISQKGLNDFSFSNPSIMFWLFLAGPVTVIPLYLYLRGVELAGLGPSGMVFFIAPTGQFLLGIFYFNENDYVFDKFKPYLSKLAEKYSVEKEQRSLLSLIDLIKNF